MTLQEEIEKASKGINTTSYPMSIGELISLYRDHEIDLRGGRVRRLRRLLR